MLYAVSHLPIFSILRSSTTTKDESSTHKPSAYLFRPYYTQKQQKNKQNSFSALILVKISS